MNTKHTPGPWTVVELSDEFFLDTNQKWAIGGGPTFRIAKIEGMGSEYEANAHLIAAAPELLAACYETLRSVDALAVMSDYPKDNRVAQILRAAIAKAEGK